jgi:hypothetical protein
MVEHGESENHHGPTGGAAAISAFVFLSYASHDVELAKQVCTALEAAGLQCWMAPRDVKPGAQYADAIVGALTEATAVALVLSGSAIASSHVAREVERAASKHKPIIAFRIDGAPLNRTLEYFLGESQWIDVPAPGMSEALSKLIEAAGKRSVTRARENPVQHRGGGTTRRIAVAAAILVCVGAAAALGLHSWSLTHRSAPSTASITDRSIAVLPFTDMSEKKDQEYFADGMADEIIDLLTRVPAIKVIGRTSSFQFIGKKECGGLRYLPFKALEPDPRYKAFLRRMNLPENSS